MKNLKAWLVLLPMLTIACSDDYQNENISYKNASKLKNLPASTNSLPHHYDAGIFQNEILDIYENSLKVPINFVHVVYSVDSIASHTSGLHPSLLLPAHANQISWILTHENTALPQILSSSALGPGARSSFQYHVNTIIYSSNPVDDQQAMVILDSYEDSILENETFTEDEKQILLITCSLWEYSLLRKRRKDFDWRTSVGHIAAMLYGAQQDIDVAARISAVAGLCTNYGVMPDPN